MTGPVPGKNPEKYTHGHHSSVVSAHAVRRASEAAAFVLPELKSPMRLLDFGCGPGTITIDLAEHLLPGGSVVGIDSSEAVVEQARASASEKVFRTRISRSTVSTTPGMPKIVSTLHMPTRFCNFFLIL